jgi:hypothetical protein
MEPVPTSVMQVLTLDALFFVPEHFHSESEPKAAEFPGNEKAETFLGALFCLPIAGFCVYIGFGLLMRNIQACALAILTSFMTVLFWLRGLMFAWAFQTIHEQYFTSAQAQSNIMLALLLNLLIFCYLAHDEAVAHSFLPLRRKPSIY